MRKIYANIPFWSSNEGKKFRVGLKRLKNIRVGRVTGTKHIFLFGLIKEPWPEVHIFCASWNQENRIRFLEVQNLAPCDFRHVTQPFRSCWPCTWRYRFGCKFFFCKGALSACHRHVKVFYLIPWGPHDPPARKFLTWFFFIGNVKLKLGLQINYRKSKLRNF